jgi:acetyl-CoA acetyltransferase family protein
MKFEHLVEVNDFLNPLMEALSREALWKGLLRSAEEPREFLPNLDDARIVARTADSLQRELRFGQAVIRDHVQVRPHAELEIRTEATPSIPAARRTLRIEEPAPGELFVRFLYEQFPQGHPPLNEEYATALRNAWLQAGLPMETPATTVDRQCGSAQQAVNFGAALIAAGIHDVVIGSGVEHMGHLPFAAGMKTQQEFGSAFTAKLMEKHNIVGQGLGAEMIADQWEIPRSELDELALRSHQLAAKATEEGKFEREIVPFQVNGDTYVTDQGIRPDTSLEALASLKPVFKEDGRITAGNSSQISDGAAAVLLMSREKADQLGLRPRAKIVDQTTVGCDPVKMLEGPIPATAKILQRNAIAMSDIDLVEINEAFAPVIAAWAREHSPDMDRVNPRGGAMAIGHPLGSTGARLLTTLLHELEDEDKELGLVTMCCGGGLGTATLIQRV